MLVPIFRIISRSVAGKSPLPTGNSTQQTNLRYPTNVVINLHEIPQSATVTYATIHELLKSN